MAAERAGQNSNKILDTKQFISSPEIPAKCAQQLGGSPSTDDGDV